MPKREDVLQQMIASLTLNDREWDIQPGTAEYKILEAAAQQIESISYNSTLNDYHFDVDSKVGLELDMFMALFGFTRIRGKRATGQVTFGMKSSATQDYVIPRGAQVAVPSTDASPAIYFTTTTEAVLAQGQKEMAVPVEAVLAGTSGNVASGAISAMASTVGAISYVYNAEDMSGGMSAETDFDLRDRWRRTVFRNQSGTEDQFLGVAYNESAFVKRATLVSPVERYSEQIQLIPPMDMDNQKYPWAAADVKVYFVTPPGDNTAEGLIVFGDTDGINDVFRFGEPEFTANQIWLGVFSGTLGDKLVAIYLADRVYVDEDNNSVGFYVASIDGADLDENWLFDGTGDPAALCTVGQLFLSYNNDIQYAFPAGAQAITYNTSGSDLVNVAVPSTQIRSQVLDYYYGTYNHLNGVFKYTDDEMIADIAVQDFPAYLSKLQDAGLLETNQVPPNIGPYIFVTPKGAAKMGYDSIIDLEYEYTPESSRNVPTDSGGIVNKIDIFTDGMDTQRVIEQVPFPAWGELYPGDLSYKYNLFGDDSKNLPPAEFRRDSGVIPRAGNVFMPMAKQPVTYAPESITAVNTVGDVQRSTTYYLNEDYWLVKSIADKVQGSPRAIGGLEWKLTTNAQPASEAWDGDDAADFHVENLTGDSPEGKLLNKGAYAYVMTWEDANGNESLSTDAFSVATGTENHVSVIKLGDAENKVNVFVPSITTCGGGADDYIRRIYRTKGINGTLGEAKKLADMGEIFLVQTITNPAATSFIDVTADSALSTTKTPPWPLPVVDTPVELEYVYNKLTERLDKSVELVRLVGQDTLVHEATPYNARLNLAVVPAYTTNIETLRTELIDMFANWTDRKRFMDNIQIADIIGLMETLPNIDNVRLSSIYEAENDLQTIRIWNNNADASCATPSGSVNSNSGEEDIWFELDGYQTENITWDCITNKSRNEYNVDIIRHLFENLPNVEPGLENAFTLKTALLASDETPGANYTNKTVEVNEGATAPAWSVIATNIDPEYNTSNYREPEQYNYNVSPKPSDLNYDGYYLRLIQIDNEIMSIDNAIRDGVNLVDGVSSANGTIRVQRGVFDTKISAHDIGAKIHILGDIAVGLSNESALPDGTEKGKAFEIHVLFIPNVVTTARWNNADNPITNRWGYRYVPIIQPFTGGAASVTVDKSVHGCGFGIDHLADDNFTMVDLPITDDIYMGNSELPFITDIGLVFRARNTF